jgi:hypothetical protein
MSEITEVKEGRREGVKEVRRGEIRSEVRVEAS